MEHWRSEIESGFPLLRGTGQQSVLEMIEPLDHEERVAFGEALAKRGHPPDLLSAWGYPLSERDREFQSLYLNMMEGVVSGRVRLSKYKDQMLKETLSRKQRREFKTAIVQALASVLGDEYQDWGGWKEWRYCTPLGPWQVITYIDIGGRFHELCYEHDIIASENLYLAENINLLRWLGIASQRQWHGVSDPDIERTAISLADIITYFMDAAPRLLDGLSPD
jgi:hypothetical protein